MIDFYYDIIYKKLESCLFSYCFYLFVLEEVIM